MLSYSKLNEVGSAKRRLFQRAEVSGEVMIHNETHLYIAPLYDISAGGLFINKLVSIPTGTEVRVVIKSPHLTEPVQAVGTVVRIENNDRRGLAIEFLTLSVKARDVIKTAVCEQNLESAFRVA